VTREAQRQQTFQLVALRDVDRLRAHTRQLIEAVPRLLAGRRRDSQAARTALDAARHKLQGFRSHLKSLELDLAEREAALNRASGNLLGAKTNQEYSLLQSEIGRKREEKGQAEEQILEQFEVIKQGEQLVREAEARLAQAEEEFEAFERRAQRELGEHQQELARQDERREQIRKAISPEVLKVYDRAYGAHGEGVVPIENNICQGCFSTITPNDRSRLLSSLELVVCRSCQRIVYLPEALQASPAG
jgi:predicted  nucleic acid-binding Zn-ribbon protein